MLHLKHVYARLVFVFVLGLFSTSIANAQSTIYFFMRTTYCCGDGGGVDMYVNGQNAFSMRGPLKKIQGNLANPSMPLHHYSAAKRKCIFNEEGKALFAVDYKYVTPANKESDLTAEIQLNLSEGSVHYVKIEPKGLNDLQFKELSEKEATKLMKDKKYVELPEYTVE